MNNKNYVAIIILSKIKNYCITFWFIISPHNKGNKDKLPDALVEGSVMEIRMKGPQFQGTLTRMIGGEPGIYYKDINEFKQWALLAQWK